MTIIINTLLIWRFLTGNWRCRVSSEPCRWNARKEVWTMLWRLLSKVRKGQYVFTGWLAREQQIFMGRNWWQHYMIEKFRLCSLHNTEILISVHLSGDGAIKYQ